MNHNPISWHEIRDEVLANPEVKAEYDKIGRYRYWLKRWKNQKTTKLSAQ